MIRTDLRRIGCCALVPVLMSLPVWGVAQTVYRNVSDSGVVSFSDVATEGAERLELSAAPVRENAQVAQQALIEQQLAVAKALEESRLARAEARTKRLQALAAVQPRTVYYREVDRTRYVGGYWGGRPPHKPGYPGHPGYPSHPGHPSLPIEPPPNVRPPSRPVPFPVQNFSGG